MMQEAAWKKSSKVLKIAYLGKDGRLIDEKRFHSSYLEWVQTHNNTFDDECVPQDHGVYTDHNVILLKFVNPNMAFQHRHVTYIESGIGHGPTFTDDRRTAQNELLNNHQQMWYSVQQEHMACSAAELLLLRDSLQTDCVVLCCRRYCL